MRYLKLLLQKIKTHTIIKYLFSYLLIFTLLISGFFFIIKDQLTHQYYYQLCLSAQNNLSNYAAQLTNNIIYLNQIDHALISNIDIILPRYQLENGNHYKTMKELEKYDVSSELIDSIIYMINQSNTIFSTKLVATYHDGVFYFYPGNSSSLSFAPASYLNASTNQLIFLSNNDKRLLLYFPSNTSDSKYIRFYSLNTESIQTQLRNLASIETLSVALISPDKQIITGVNEKLLLPYLDTFEASNGIYPLEESNTLCVCTDIGNGFTLLSLLSNEILFHQINLAFAKAYFSLFLLGLAGIFLIAYALKLTYLPLHILTVKFASSPSQQLDNTKHGDLERLEHTFIHTMELNEQLQNKLENYRLFMQKSLFESNFMTNHQETEQDALTLEHFFNNSFDNEIFLIYIRSPEQDVLHGTDIQQYFQEILPGNNSCYILEDCSSSAVFLLNYAGNEPNKSEILKEILNSFYEEKGYVSAISNSSNSPLDVPSLYQNVMVASKQLPQSPVVDYSLLTLKTDVLSYPHQELLDFTEALKTHAYQTASSLAEQFFTILDHAEDYTNTPYLIFYQKSILIDILTIIANALNQANIKFKTYQDLYFDTLFYCRSSSYHETKNHIKTNILSLLVLYEHEAANKFINASNISCMMEKNYFKPDFSINLLADHFHVSIAYMSYLFKKEMQMNFIDYLWNLRLEKSKKLLSTTDLSIDAISVSCGYLNTSSFRRRFKQELGLTPSEYRKQTAKN